MYSVDEVIAATDSGMETSLSSDFSSHCSIIDALETHNLIPRSETNFATKVSVPRVADRFKKENKER